MQLQKIAASLQAGVISSFWSMLRELESQADNTRDAVLHVQVEGWYRQWNMLTGSDLKPIWLTRQVHTVKGEECIS